MLMLLELLAGSTGLEPATSGVTGQHSNRLNYHSAETDKFIGRFRRMQHPPLRIHPCADTQARECSLVGTEGIEPPTRSV